MRIPATIPEQERFLRWLIDACTKTQPERRTLYEKRRRYYLYGQNETKIVRFNKLKSHLALLRSFVYAEDSCSFSVSAPKNADDKTIAQFLAVEDDWNTSFTESGLADAYDEALLWGIVYDTMIIKLGWNDVDKQEFAQLVEPAAFGVFEEYKEFESQQAMTHTFILDYDDAVERMLRAGLAHRIGELKEIGGGVNDTGLPGTLNQLVISATGGTNVQGNVTGEINPNYEAAPSYSAKVSHSVVAFHEVTVWDSESMDWRYFHVIEPNIIISDSKKTIDVLQRMGSKKVPAKYASSTNFFIKSEHPFIAVTPYPIFNYIWGDCHLEDLIPLQVWMNTRLDQIDEILEQQVDPAKDFAGFSGMDDERMEAWGGPGTYVQDALPGAKATMHAPQMPPDLFAEFNVINDVLFLEQSGFTEILAGRGEKNVRGRGHARELKTTGGGRIRKVASGLERSLTRLADKGLRLKAKNDDTPLKAEDGSEFIIAQVLDGSYGIGVAGHSHSPLFTMESTELAMALFKAKAIDREWLIRLTRPSHMRDLIHRLKQIVKAEMQQRQAQIAAAANNPRAVPHERKPNGVAPIA